MNYLRQLRNFSLFSGGAVFHHYVSKALDYNSATQAEIDAALQNKKLDKISNNVEYIKVLMDKENIDKKVLSCLDKLDTNLDKFNDVSKVSDLKDLVKVIKGNTDEIIKILEKSNSNTKSKKFINEFYEYLDNLTLFQESSLLNIIIFVILLLSVLNIVFILFGNEIIIKFSLETRFPKFAKIIKLRNKLSKFSLYWNIVLLIIICIIGIFVNIFNFGINY